MSSALAKVKDGELSGWTPEQVELIKATVCKGATDDEFKLFRYAANRSGLDPLTRQIHAVKRWDSKLGREVMAVQTGIDGYRLIAERTKSYRPGDITWEMGPNGIPVSATAEVFKLINGEWHSIKATAFYSEYVAKVKDGSPNPIWRDKPRLMISKCAEALALRRAFPLELSDIYTEDEVASIKDVTPTPIVAAPTRKSETVKVEPVEVQAEPITAQEEAEQGQAFIPGTEPEQKEESRPVDAEVAFVAPEGCEFAEFVPKAVTVKEGTNKKGKPYKKVGIQDQGGNWYGSFDTAYQVTAEQAKESGATLRVVYKVDGNFRNIESVEAV